MDDLRFRKLKALQQAMDHEFFGQAIAELKREIADEMADCVGPAERIGALKAERFALDRLRGRLESYVNELTILERKTNG